jgi:hypothetical protein
MLGCVLWQLLCAAQLVSRSARAAGSATRAWCDAPVKPRWLGRALAALVRSAARKS